VVHNFNKALKIRFISFDLGSLESSTALFQGYPNQKRWIRFSKHF